MDEFNEKKNENEKTENIVENVVDELDQFLSGLESGYTLVISREEPSWCRGLLEQISISDASNPIGIDYLIKTWGGYRLRLRFRRPNGQWVKHRDLPLFSFEPRRYGKIIRNPMNMHISEDFDEQSSQLLTTDSTQVQQGQQNDTKKEILELFQMMQAMRADDWKIMTQFIAPRETPDPFQMVNSAFSLFSKMQNFQGLQSKSISENDEVIGLLGKLTDIFGNQKQGKAPKLVDTSVQPVNNTSISKQLSGLEPEDAVGQLQDAVSLMDPEKQVRAFSALISSIDRLPGGTDLLLSQLENRGIISDEEYDEPEATSDKSSRGKFESDE